tara:strand:- start:273 stop:521 length:249 start_codon:yes stop_codon:yes gene_type:complete
VNKKIFSNIIMLSWIYGKYFYIEELFKIIEEIETKRQLRRLKGSTMSTTFSQDLKNKLNGVEIVSEKVITKTKSDSEVTLSV